jgi:hypothetical protein
MTPQEQRWAASLSLALLSAVLAPIRHNWSARPRDGFPFSHYPMFSARRRATTTVHYLAGVTAERIRLPYRFAGTGGLNQVRRQINRLVAEGRVDVLCARVAAELARRHSGGGRYADVVAVDVMRGRFRLDDCFVGGRIVGQETVLVSLGSASE